MCYDKFKEELQESTLTIKGQRDEEEKEEGKYFVIFEAGNVVESKSWDEAEETAIYYMQDPCIITTEKVAKEILEDLKTKLSL